MFLINMFSIICSRLTKEDYNVLAGKIICLFPNETLGVYYCPPIPKYKHPLKKSIMAKGKLVNQVRNILFRSGDTLSRRATKRTLYEGSFSQNSFSESLDNGQNLQSDGECFHAFWPSFVYFWHPFTCFFNFYFAFTTSVHRNAC